MPSANSGRFSNSTQTPIATLTGKVLCKIKDSPLTPPGARSAGARNTTTDTAWITAPTMMKSASRASSKRDAKRMGIAFRVMVQLSGTG